MPSISVYTVHVLGRKKARAIGRRGRGRADGGRERERKREKYLLNSMEFNPAVTIVESLKRLSN
jgi:hypothetical protein